MNKTAPKKTTTKKSPVKKTITKRKPPAPSVKTIADEIMKKLASRTAFDGLFDEKEIAKAVENYSGTDIPTTAKKSRSTTVGRPSRYNKSYCKKVIEYSAQGMHIKFICLKLGISEVTLKNWKEAHPEFLKAIKIGKKIREQAWIEIGRRNLNNKNFNHVLWMMNMNNMFGWRNSNSVTKVEKTKKITKELKIEYSERKLITVGTILAKSGAISIERAGDITDAEVDKVHPA